MNTALTWLLKQVLGPALADSNRVRVALISTAMALLTQWWPAMPTDTKDWISGVVAAVGVALIAGLSHRDAEPKP